MVSVYAITLTQHCFVFQMVRSKLSTGEKETAKAKKKQQDRDSGKTRINIKGQHQRWQQFAENHGGLSNEEVAQVLIDL